MSHDYWSTPAAAREMESIGYQDGQRAGHQRGLNEGFRKGMNQGIQQGRQEAWAEVQPQLNAANEMAVAAFLAERIGFLDIPEVVEHSLNHVQNGSADSIDTILQTDQLARQVASQRITQLES